jgi:isopropylmalate/homocitrate/citramalate synthase
MRSRRTGLGSRKSELVTSVGHTAISPWNGNGLDLEALRSRPPRIADCTLRDGEQQPGVVFSTDQKIEIATMLAALGVHELELGTPAVSAGDADAIAKIVELGLPSETSALARASTRDVDLVRSCGVDAVRLSMPISERQREAKTGVGSDEYVGKAVEISQYARSQGLRVIFSPFDTTRCELKLLEALLVAFRSEGCVDRVRLVDTTGAASPEAIRYLLRFMQEAGDGIPIEVHCHDDFGLATANTLAGALAGAEFLSVTVNGLGERSGNAALEEVVASLAILYGVDTGLDLSGLTRLSLLVEESAAVQLQPHKPVVGANSFAHESGLVVSGLLRDPFTAEAYEPEIVGQKRRIVIGKKSGRASVEAKLGELYEEQVHGVDIEELVSSVKERSIALGRSLHDDEFRALVDGAGSA